MDEAKKIISLLKRFDRWDIGGSKTQVTATETEDFVADCFQQVLGDKIKIFKMGSQQHPDFMMIPSSMVSSLEEFKENVVRKDRITLGVLRDWEASKYNKKKIRILRVEVKTGKSVYTLNDTFPKPFKNMDEIYVLFAIGEKKVYVTTSYTMAEANKTNPPIPERYEESKEAVKNFHETLKNIWEDTGISTAARPTYRMNQGYSHHEATSETISELLEEAGFS
tara:strand:+ start:548 stop:1216 length:669 start_codon:yes stop_codon:yes gene_type:complete